MIAKSEYLYNRDLYNILVVYLINIGYISFKHFISQLKSHCREGINIFFTDDPSGKARSSRVPHEFVTRFAFKCNSSVVSNGNGALKSQVINQRR